MEHPSKKFGDRLRVLIQRRGITLDQFAAQYGIAESQLHNWLKRDDPPLAKHWEKLASFFGVNRSYIIGADSDSRIGEPQQLEVAGVLRAKIRERVENVLALAGDDLGRLGWVHEQLIQHVSAPENWDIHERVIRRVLQEEEAEKHARAQSARAHGKAS